MECPSGLTRVSEFDPSTAIADLGKAYCLSVCWAVRRGWEVVDGGKCGGGVSGGVGRGGCGWGRGRGWLVE